MPLTLTAGVSFLLGLPLNEIRAKFHLEKTSKKFGREKWYSSASCLNFFIFPYCIFQQQIIIFKRCIETWIYGEIVTSKSWGWGRSNEYAFIIFIHLLHCIHFCLELENSEELPYIKVAKMTRKVPMTKYPPGIRSFKTKYEKTDETIMEIEVANPFRMLSAYFTVIATTRPPKAWKKRKMLNKTEIFSH